MIQYEKEIQQTIPTSQILILGLGGAGANMIDRVIMEGLKGPEILAVNADLRTLQASSSKNKIQLGPHVTRGLGCGGDPEIGQKAALESESEIRAAIKGRKIIFLCVGLGGGTGSGASPLITRIAREEGAFTVVFAAMPFAFEGTRRRMQAETALNELAVMANALVTFDNGRMAELVLANQGIHEAFTAANNLISESIHAISRIALFPGIVHIGLDDLVTTLSSNRSRCLFGAGRASNEDRVLKALDKALASPLIDKGKLLKTVDAVLVHICGGPSLTIFESELMMTELTKKINPAAQIFFGVSVDDSLQDEFSVTIISSLPEEQVSYNTLEEHNLEQASTEAPTPIAPPVTPPPVLETTAAPSVVAPPVVAPPVAAPPVVAPPVVAPPVAAPPVAAAPEQAPPTPEPRNEPAMIFSPTHSELDQEAIHSSSFTSSEHFPSQSPSSQADPNALPVYAEKKRVEPIEENTKPQASPRAEVISPPETSDYPHVEEPAPSSTRRRFAHLFKKQEETEQSSFLNEPPHSSSPTHEENNFPPKTRNWLDLVEESTAEPVNNELPSAPAQAPAPAAAKPELPELPSQVPFAQPNPVSKKPNYTEPSPVTPPSAFPQAPQPPKESIPTTEELLAPRDGMKTQSKISKVEPETEMFPSAFLQGELQLDGQPKGRFEGESPNIYEGEDLDIPTFLRDME